MSELKLQYQSENEDDMIYMKTSEGIPCLVVGKIYTNTTLKVGQENSNGEKTLRVDTSDRKKDSIKQDHPCPRSYGHPFTDRDVDHTWDKEKNGDHTCSFCGSWKTDEFLKFCKESETGFLEVSDKKYKIYVKRPGISNAGEGPIKFYTMHLDPRTSDEDIKIINEAVKRLNKNNPYKAG